MTLMAWLGVAVSVLAAIILAALIWLAGPLISFDDFQPFEGALTRIIIIAVLFLIVGGLIVWRILARRRSVAKLEEAMTAPAREENDAPVLKEKMHDALETLKRAKTKGANALYDLPWYLIIGPPGAGKTTALVNSGLKFPLAGDSTARSIQGVGGTRYCDWWFTDQAVLIDTAGRYTTQDSDAKADRQSWLAFLKLLAENRPKQPINGVIVAISVADVINLSPQDVGAHADAIRKRLNELQEELKIDFPVYAMFTKMDLVTGFMQYFADLDETRRKAVWGATFQGAQRRANNVAKVPEEIDLLIQRLTERMPERLQDEPDLRARALLFGLPAQIGAIRKPISDFLNRIFEPTRYQTSATLRGFYFTSGTQEGTPFDAVIGALQKSYGVDSLGASAFSGAGKSFFLHDLIADVIFGEAGWVSTNIGAVRRAFFFRAAAFTLILLGTAGMVGLWYLSYLRNGALIATTQTGIDAYAKAANPLIDQKSVTDPDLRPVYELIGALPELPVGYNHEHDPTPIVDTFGLSQRDRVEDASLGVYRDALERLMRPRLVLSLEQQLQKNIGDPTYVYEALKVYLMLGGKAPELDKALILDWFSRDWEERVFPGAPYAQGRALLRAHLQAMLELGEGHPPRVSLNGPLVEQAQATLARMPVATRAYTLLKTEAHNEAISDWVASEHGGQDMQLVFETTNGTPLDAVRVPAFFTYAGFYAALLAHMTTIADQLQKENWVLGPSGEQQAIKTQYESLFPNILELYGNDFLAAWNTALSVLKLKSFFADKPKYLVLSAASAPTSPIRLLFESIRDETALTRERPAAGGQSSAAGAAANEAANQAKIKAGYSIDSRLGTSAREVIEAALKAQRRAGDPPAEVPGAAIENNFKPFQTLVDGDPGSRPIDALLANLNELYRQETLAASNPAQAAQALDQIQVQIASLRANETRLPPPLNTWVDHAAQEAQNDASATSIAELSQEMADEVTAPCQKIANNLYPFAKSDKDVALADFSRLFSPNGVIDKFFNTKVAPLVNQSGKTWTWKANPNLTRKLSDTTLHQFQQAADIRDAFFPTGGAQPNLNFDVKTLTISADAQTATLSVNGANIVSQQGQNQPATLQWPGAGAGAASITFAPDLPDRKSTLDRSGAWAFFRLVDTGQLIPHGNAVSVSFVVGGREVSYQFSSASQNNPLSMSSLRQFKCPVGL